MRIILKTIIWFSIVLYLIAEDKGVFEHWEASVPGDALSVESLLQAQSLLDRAGRFCENRQSECQQLGELAVKAPVNVPRSTGESEIGN